MRMAGVGSACCLYPVSRDGLMVVVVVIIVAVYGGCRGITGSRGGAVRLVAALWELTRVAQVSVVGTA